MTRLTSFVGILTIASVSAFSQHSDRKSQPAKLQDAGDVNLVAKAFATAAMTAFLWATPVPLTPQLPGSPYIANAVEKASGTGSRVNKDAESLLRLGLPIKNKEVRHLSIYCHFV